MQLAKRTLTVVTSLAALALASAAHAAPSATGVWIDHTGRGAVEITECGSALCGRIVWLKDASHGSVCGTQVIGDAKPSGSGIWDNGWIYDPEKAAKYSVELRPIGSDKLRVLGYLGSKFFSETMIWKRAGADLNRCDQPAPKAAAAPAPAAPVEKAELTPVQPKQAERSPAPAKAEEAESAAPAPAPRKAGERRAPKAASAGRTCTVEFSGIRVSFPCQE
jgi:uncharacterized protein (DUF2147 family)